MSDLSSPIATYDHRGGAESGLIADNCLFFGSFTYIIVYEISASLTEPLKALASIRTSLLIYKMIKVGKDILLGEFYGYLEVFDIENFKITHS